MNDEQKKRMTPAELERIAEDEFLGRLKDFLMSEPYFVTLLTGTGRRGKHGRKHAGRILGKALTTIPKLTLKDRPAGLPNRADRRAILKQIR